GTGPAQTARAHHETGAASPRARVDRAGEKCDPASAESMGTERAPEQRIARITLAAEARYLAPARAFIREAVASLGLASPDVSGLERAVEEVASNVIRQAFEPGQQASFDILLLPPPPHLLLSLYHHT